MPGIEKLGQAPKQVETKQKVPKALTFWYPNNLVRDDDAKAMRDAILIVGHMFSLFDQDKWIEDGRYEPRTVLVTMRSVQSRLLERYREIIQTPYEKFYFLKHKTL